MDQSERDARAVRAARVWEHARTIWRNDVDTHAFLNHPHPFLGGRKPLEMALSSEVDLMTVDHLLGCIEHGIYS